MIFSRYTTTYPSKSKRLLDLTVQKCYNAFDLKVQSFVSEERYESGFNQRPRRPVDAAVCHSHDLGRPASAVLQHRRHADRRPGSRAGRAGGRRLVVHADDLSDLDSSRPVHGQRRAGFHALRAAGRAGAAREPLRVLPVYRARDRGADRFGVCLSGRASRVPARARGRMG